MAFNIKQFIKYIYFLYLSFNSKFSQKWDQLLKLPRPLSLNRTVTKKIVFFPINRGERDKLGGKLKFEAKK